jgi:hypothetical protein
MLALLTLISATLKIKAKYQPPHPFAAGSPIASIYLTISIEHGLTVVFDAKSAMKGQLDLDRPIADFEELLAYLS